MTTNSIPSSMEMAEFRGSRERLMSPNGRFRVHVALWVGTLDHILIAPHVHARSGIKRLICVSGNPINKTF